MADSIILGSNRVRLADVTGSTADPLETGAMNFGYEVVGVTFYVKSTIPGSFMVQVFLGVQDDDNPELLAAAGWADLPNFVPAAIAADTLAEFTLADQGLPPVRATFDPNSTPHDTLIIGWGFGS